MPESKRRRPPLSLKKKLCFTALTLAVLAAPLWLLMEVGYRWAFGIPLVGGTLYEGDLKMPSRVLESRPWYRNFLAAFRHSDNPILFYEPRPGYRGRFYESRPGHTGKEIAINADGFRDHAYPRQKPAGVFRIVVLGDSIVWGHGLALEDTFAKQRSDGSTRSMNSRSRCSIAACRGIPRSRRSSCSA